MMDLDCKRGEAVSQYNQALAVRDGQQDTRIAAERGVKTAYAVKGHTCDAEDSDEPNEADPNKASDATVPQDKGQDKAPAPPLAPAPSLKPLPQAVPQSVPAPQ
jgi:hypothetical protein